MAVVGRRSASATAPTTVAPFRSSWEALRHLRRHEGVVQGLWRGNSWQLASIAAQGLCHYELSDGVMRGTYVALAPETALGHLTATYAGFFATGFVCALLPYPLDFLRFHMAVDLKGLGGPSRSSSSSSLSSSTSRGSFAASSHGAGTPHTSFSAFTHTSDYKVARGLHFLRRHPVLRESPRYCFTGLGLHVFGSAMYYLSHRVLTGVMEAAYYRRWQRRRRAAGMEEDEEGFATMVGPRPPSMLMRVVADGVATLCATAVAHPVDVVRRRQMLAVTGMVRGSSSLIPPATTGQSSLLGPRWRLLRYHSSWECGKQIMTEEGVRGFFRGLPISLSRMVVLATLMQGVGILEGELVRRGVAAGATRGV